MNVGPQRWKNVMAFLGAGLAVSLVLTACGSTADSAAPPQRQASALESSGPVYRPYYQVYTSIVDNPELDLPQMMSESGTSSVILSAIQGTTGSKNCEGSWQGLGVNEASQNNAIKAKLQDWAKYIGGNNLTLSFGGNTTGDYLEQACWKANRPVNSKGETDTSNNDTIALAMKKASVDLAEQYKKYIADYGVQSFDFNLEGPERATADYANYASKLPAMALKLVKEVYPKLKVGYTVEEDWSTTDATLKWWAKPIIEDAVKNGVSPAWLNVMVMHLPISTTASSAILPSSKQVALAATRFLEGSTVGIKTGASKLVGIVNNLPDVPNQGNNLTEWKPADATALRDWSMSPQGVSIGYLSPWALAMDYPCRVGRTIGGYSFCSPSVTADYQNSKLMNPGGKFVPLTPLPKPEEGIKVPIEMTATIAPGGGKNQVLKIEDGRVEGSVGASSKITPAQIAGTIKSETLVFSQSADVTGNFFSAGPGTFSNLNLEKIPNSTNVAFAAGQWWANNNPMAKFNFKLLYGSPTVTPNQYKFAGTLRLTKTDDPKQDPEPAGSKPATLEFKSGTIGEAGDIIETWTKATDSSAMEGTTSDSQPFKIAAWQAGQENTIYISGTWDENTTIDSLSIVKKPDGTYRVNDGIMRNGSCGSGGWLDSMLRFTACSGISLVGIPVTITGNSIIIEGPVPEATDVKIRLEFSLK